MDKCAIIFFGPPGCGKGTQADILAKELKIKKYGMSNLIKKSLDKIKHYDITKGILLNDLDCFDIFYKGVNLKKSFIIDGFPRTKNQSIWLYGLLKINHYKIIFIHLDVSKVNLIKRIKIRKKIENRKDDSEKIFEKRYLDYKKNSKQILNLFSKKYNKIESNDEVNKIHKNIILILKKYKIKTIK